MQKLIKILIIGIIPITSILLILLFINTTIIDWKYAHKSLMTYQKPFDWALYQMEINFFKFVRKINPRNQIGLNKVNLYISEKSQKHLLSDVPNSTKEWQNAFYLNDNKTFKKIMIRHRGDNPRNWLFEKKHYRIKTLKKEPFERHRYYNFLPYNLSKFISGKIANDLNLLSPKYSLIELFINDESSGIYINSEKINENFLRRNKFMPVNIYKGEQIFSESVINTENDLFNNKLTWKKLANFNKLNRYNKDDLEFFLNLLRKSEVDKKAFDLLIEKIHLESWSKFAAYQILTQNYHNDSSHNMRLVIDPWSGKIYPIIHDPLIGTNINDNKISSLNFSSHALLLLLNKNSFFINKKFQHLYDFLYKDNILDNQIKFLNKIENKISISEIRDIELQRHFYKTTKFNQIFKKEKKISDFGINERNELKRSLLTHKKKLMENIFKNPDVNWFFKDKDIAITINGDFPVSNLEILFEKNIPEWVSIDMNLNQITDKNEKFYTNKNGNVLLPISLYANRATIAENSYDLNEPHLLTSNTKFILKTSNNSMPKKIFATNLFSLEKFEINMNEKKSVKVNKFNLPILIGNPSENIQNLKGTIQITRNTIYNNSVNIEPGTKFLLNNDVSIIFKNKVNAVGTSENPIIFSGNDKSQWGTIAIIGKKTSESTFKNIKIDGGTGSIIDQVHFTSMFSLHNTENIKLINIEMKNNSKYDDSLHLVYCKNVLIKNLYIENAFGDALDIDISENVLIKNSKFNNSNNDSIDIMESIVLIDSSEMKKSGDKGISIGENSNVLVLNSNIIKNKIGIASKDRSIAKVIHSNFLSNKSHIDAYQKNFQYGDGGKINIYQSIFKGKINTINSDSKSNIYIDDSSFNNKFVIQNKNILLSNTNDFDGEMNNNKKLNSMITHPLKKFTKVKINKKSRGSNL
jgi:hypothetical protein